MTLGLAFSTQTAEATPNTAQLERDIDALESASPQLTLQSNFVEGALSYRTTRTSTTRRTRRSVRRRAYSRRSYRRSSRSRSYRRRRTVVHHRAHREPSVTSSRTGLIADFLIEAGGSIFAPLQGEMVSGLQLAMGSRLGPVAGLVEMQLTQGEIGAQITDLNAQLRVYLPLGNNAEIYPLLAIGESNILADVSSSHLDLGIGAQLNITSNLGVGARYSARLIADAIGGAPTNGHNLTAQVALRF